MISLRQYLVIERGKLLLSYILLMPKDYYFMIKIKNILDITSLTSLISNQSINKKSQDLNIALRYLLLRLLAKNLLDKKVLFVIKILNLEFI